MTMREPSARGVPSTRDVPVASGSRARQLYGMAADAPRFLQRQARVHGLLVGLRLGRGPVLLVTDPEAARAILVDERAFPKGPGSALPGANGESPLKPVLGNGLLTSRGEHHKRQRRLIQPAFHRERISGYASSMVDEADRMLRGWRDGDIVDVHAAFAETTLRILTRTVFSVDLEAGDAAMIRDAVGSTMRGPGANVALVAFSRRFGGRALVARREAMAGIDTIIARLIRDRRSDLAARSADSVAGAGHADVLSWLLDAQDDETDRVSGGPLPGGLLPGGAAAGARMTDADVRDEVLTLLLAGHETSTNALSWAFHLLGQHPDVERSLHAELDRVLPGRLPTVDDLANLHLTRAVTDEAMRLFPPAWIMVRHAGVDTELLGHRVAAGTTILLSPYVTHRDPAHWQHPETFDPSRWLTGRDGGYDPAPQTRYAYFPFGGGPRMCIGNTFALTEIALVLAVTAARFRMEGKPGHRVGMTPRVTLRPRGGMPMVIHAREGRTASGQ